CHLFAATFVTSCVRPTRASYLWTALSVGRPPRLTLRYRAASARQSFASPSESGACSPHPPDPRSHEFVRLDTCSKILTST
ncbi:unnamed protein product, partial [Nesidiocoris tenuis]